LTRSVTEMSTRIFPGCKGRLVSKADKLTAICELIAQKMWEPRRLITYGSPWSVIVIVVLSLYTSIWEVGTRESWQNLKLLNKKIYMYYIYIFPRFICFYLLVAPTPLLYLYVHISISRYAISFMNFLEITKITECYHSGFHSISHACKFVNTERYLCIFEML
jgi:hypothetical protein